MLVTLLLKMVTQEKRILHLSRAILQSIPVKFKKQQFQLDTLNTHKHYIPSRYPDAYPSGRPEDYYTEKIAKEAITCVLKIKQFAQELMQ